MTVQSASSFGMPVLRPHQSPVDFRNGNDARVVPEHNRQWAMPSTSRPMVPLEQDRAD